MEFLLIVVVPGVLGGVVTALVLLWFHAHHLSTAGGPPLEAPSPAAINMARIRVQGVGGLGLVAMAVAVAIGVPRIRLTMAVALALGIALALVLIAMRQRMGPLPSSSRRSGAHSWWWPTDRLK